MKNVNNTTTRIWSSAVVALAFCLAAPAMASAQGCEAASNRAQTNGAIIGALAGAAVGNGVSGHHNKGTSTALGAVLGAVVGSNVGKDSANCGYQSYETGYQGRGYDNRDYGYPQPPRQVIYRERVYVQAPPPPPPPPVVYRERVVERQTYYVNDHGYDDGYRYDGPRRW